MRPLDIASGVAVDSPLRPRRRTGTLAEPRAASTVLALCVFASIATASCRSSRRESPATATPRREPDVTYDAAASDAVDRVETARSVAAIDASDPPGVQSATPLEPGAGPAAVARYVPPLVRVAPPSITGPIAAEGVRRVAVRNVASLSRCPREALAQHPALEGSVLIRMEVDSDGIVTRSTIASRTLPVVSVAECIAIAVRHWIFPRASGPGPVVIEMPFHVQHPE